MKRQRVVGVSGFEAAEMAAMAKKKRKAKPDEADHHHKQKEEQKKEVKQMEIAGTDQENVAGWANNWEETWPWIGDFVDEQMSWGSVWFPFWDMDFSGKAFVADLYGDVVWDDDIWNLKGEIPNPFEA
ncbi:uncharacterized protein LOC129310384 [Prosopis cineraria]|uniref:uncharacterized protein LOC129310384 n=1 Tax=Prosopis cineraria TaxID=364024 RepID=UPI0024107FED|nr:uncharacterized protein LOC129310384 [Prosopis cineraria]